MRQLHVARPEDTRPLYPWFHAMTKWLTRNGWELRRFEWSFTHTARLTRKQRPNTWDVLLLFVREKLLAWAEQHCFKLHGWGKIEGCIVWTMQIRIYNISRILWEKFHRYGCFFLTKWYCQKADKDLLHLGNWKLCIRWCVVLWESHEWRHDVLW